MHWSVGHPKGRCVGPASWALAQLATVAVGCSEARRNSKIFHFSFGFSQIHFGLNLNLSNFVQTEYWNEFNLSP
jgi:hypothetical protein